MAAKSAAPIEFRYEPRYCTFLKQHVWAICTQQPDGCWRIVNCLDKDEPCFSLTCAFTTSGGTWPYAEPSSTAIHLPANG